MTRQVSFFNILCSIATVRIKLFKIIDYIAGGMIAFLLPPLLNKKFPSVVNRILIVRPGGIGDAVFLLPILKALKKQNIVIDILCEQRNAEIFTSQSHLFNNIYLYEKQLFEALKASYDLIIDTEQWHYLSAIAIYFIKADYKIGFATRPLRAKLFNEQVAYGENDYELDNFKRLFGGFLALPSTINNTKDCFDVPIDLKQWASKQIPQRAVSVFLGSSIAIRRFNFIQLSIIVRYLLEQNYHPVLLGGKDVIGTSQQVVRNIKDQRVLDYTGKISLGQSAALIQRSYKFIGPDSGLMHLACAVGTPVIAVFGPGNLQKWGPKGSKHRIVTENVSCSPCTRFGYTLPSCKGGYQCMKNIKIESVIQGLNENS